MDELIIYISINCCDNMWHVAFECPPCGGVLSVIFYFSMFLFSIFNDCILMSFYVFSMFYEEHF